MSKEDWLAARQHRVTATKIIHLLGGSGANRFAEVLLNIGLGHLIEQIQKEVNEKSLKIIGGPDPEMPALLWGNAMEEHAFSTWAEKFPDLLLEYPGQLMMHPEDDRFGATPDFLIRSPVTNELWIGEIKCPWLARIPQTRNEIPKAYLLQVLHQMWITGAKYGLLIYAHFDYADPMNFNKMAHTQWVFEAPDPNVYFELVIRPIVNLLSPTGRPSPIRQLASDYWQAFGKPAVDLARQSIVGHDRNVAQALSARIRTPVANRRWVDGTVRFPLLTSALCFLEQRLAPIPHVASAHTGSRGRPASVAAEHESREV